MQSLGSLPMRLPTRKGHAGIRKPLKRQRLRSWRSGSFGHPWPLEHRNLLNRFKSRGSDYFSGFRGFRLGQLTSSLVQSLGYPPLRPPWRSGSSGHPWPLDHRLCKGFGKLSYDGNPMKTSKIVGPSLIILSSNYVNFISPLC